MIIIPGDTRADPINIHGDEDSKIIISSDQIDKFALVLPA